MDLCYAQRSVEGPRQTCKSRRGLFNASSGDLTQGYLTQTLVNWLFLFTQSSARRYCMAIDSLVQRPATWTRFVPPIPKPSPKPRPWQELELGWADLAVDGKWEESIIAYLKANWRGQHSMWRVLNTIIGETRPATRSVTREATKEALEALMELIRQRRVLRYKGAGLPAWNCPMECCRPSQRSSARSRSAVRARH